MVDKSTRYNQLFCIEISKYYAHMPRYLQLEHLHLGPDHVLIKLLNVKRFSEFLILDGSLFQIFGPKLLSV